ncbi:MAG TPA: hypothetical protein VMT22_22985 [Terriglobales bacterium]|nr:hypothetical protein [Terriglobales bacterium]
MITDHELPTLIRHAVEASAADRTSPSRRNDTAKTESSSSASFAKIAGEVNGKITAEDSRTENSPQNKSPKHFHAWQDDSFSFGDFLDIINPLQHLPIVATLYRNWTGDQIGMAPRVIGGALWGRLGGFVTGLINAVVEWFTGKDIGDHIYSAIWGKPETRADTAVVQTKEEPTSVPNAAMAPKESAAPSATEVISDPPAIPAAAQPHANSSAVPRLSSLRPIVSSELVPGPVLLHTYRCGREFKETSDYEKRLRVTA